MKTVNEVGPELTTDDVFNSILAFEEKESLPSTQLEGRQLNVASPSSTFSQFFTSIRSKLTSKPSTPDDSKSQGIATKPSPSTRERISPLRYTRIRSPQAKYPPLPTTKASKPPVASRPQSMPLPIHSKKPNTVVVESTSLDRRQGKAPAALSEEEKAFLELEEFERRALQNLQSKSGNMPMPSSKVSIVHSDKEFRDLEMFEKVAASRGVVGMATAPVHAISKITVSDEEMAQLEEIERLATQSSRAPQSKIPLFHHPSGSMTSSSGVGDCVKLSDCVHGALLVLIGLESPQALTCLRGKVTTIDYNHEMMTKWIKLANLAGQDVILQLRESWILCEIAVDDIIHVLLLDERDIHEDITAAKTSAYQGMVIDNRHGIIITHPDILVQPTKISESCSSGCMRRGVIAERVKSFGGSSAQGVLGHLRHAFIEVSSLIVCSLI